MRIFDAHCDVLMKLFSNKNECFLGKQSLTLQVTKPGLIESGVKVQLFAIYIPESVYPSMRFEAALAMVDIFYEQIIKKAGLCLIRNKSDIDNLKENDIGAILTLEGCDCIENNILRLKTLLRLGVTSVGLTWNWSTSVADGALEPRGGGLTEFGKQVVDLLEKEKIWLDVSHLSENAFWEVIDYHSNIIASHSNSRALVNHPRNLTDEQACALFEKNSVIGITFVPEFLTYNRDAFITDILRHLDHFCSLGGRRHVGFGSDFDGIDKTVRGLSNITQYRNLVNELLKHYSEAEVKGFLYENFASAYK